MCAVEACFSLPACIGSWKHTREGVSLSPKIAFAIGRRMARECLSIMIFGILNTWSFWKETLFRTWHLEVLSHALGTIALPFSNRLMKQYITHSHLYHEIINCFWLTDRCRYHYPKLGTVGGLSKRIIFYQIKNQYTADCSNYLQ